MGFGIEFAGDYAAESILLQAFGDPKRADAHEGAGLDDEIRLDGGDERLEEFEDFDFGGHRVIHAPAFRVRAFGRGGFGFRLLGQAALGGVVEDAVFFGELVKADLKDYEKRHAREKADEICDLSERGCENRIGTTFR